MALGDPALVVVLPGGGGDRFGGGLGLGLLGAGGALGLGEEGLDPGLVDKVEGAGEGGGEEEVEEDAGKCQLSALVDRQRGNAHLRIEEARRSLDNGGRGVCGLDLVDAARGVGEDGDELDVDVLGVHVLREGVGQVLLLAGGHLNVVLGGGEVADDGLVGEGVLGEPARGHEGAGHEGQLDRVGVVVGDVDEGARRAAVDELNAEDVGLGEAGRDFGEEGRGGWVGGAGFVGLEVRC